MFFQSWCKTSLKPKLERKTLQQCCDIDVVFGFQNWDEIQKHSTLVHNINSPINRHWNAWYCEAHAVTCTRFWSTAGSGVGNCYKQQWLLPFYFAVCLFQSTIKRGWQCRERQRLEFKALLKDPAVTYHLASYGDWTSKLSMISSYVIHSVFNCSYTLQMGQLNLNVFGINFVTVFCYIHHKYPWRAY